MTAEHFDSSMDYFFFFFFGVLYYVRLREKKSTKFKLAFKMHRMEKRKDEFLQGETIEKHCIRISPFIHIPLQSSRNGPSPSEA
jgi:hypothetical protein